MDDETYKKIEDIKQGDIVYGGGEVTFIGMWVAENMFDYFGDIVNGDHAVLESTEWVRVKNSEHAKPVKVEGLVYPMVTAEHRIHTENAVYADYMEVENGFEKTDIECLDELNGIIPFKKVSY